VIDGLVLSSEFGLELRDGLVLADQFGAERITRACWYSLLVGLAEGRPLDLWRFRAERGSAFGMARS
jgi:hypothetical protein